ncbi:MAG: hypothetical protein JNM31_00305 [Flavobacteriales bacterium]|nr:hypothetical protein [Flavobacteriales bacterium]
MNAPRLLATLTTVAALVLSTAFAQSPKTQFVYMIGKTDVQNVVLSPVMEVPAEATREDLVAKLKESFPQVSDATQFEGVRFTTQADAEKQLAAMRERYEKAGKKVQMLKH